jgi:hypothetical protein
VLTTSIPPAYRHQIGLKQSPNARTTTPEERRDNSSRPAYIGTYAHLWQALIRRSYDVS